MNLRSLPLCMVLVAAATTAYGNPLFTYSSLDSVKLAGKELPAGASFATENFTRSIQARTFYDDPGIFEALIGKVEEKSSQSITGPDGDQGTILYFRFGRKMEGGEFVKALVWGEEGPTAEHPEEILVADNILVIVSFRQGSPTGRQVTETLSKRLGL